MPMIRSGFILLLVLLAGLSCSKKDQMIEPVLKELDETIDNRQLFENEKQESIARLKRDLLETRDAHKRTEIYCSLFDEYKNYQYDSAFVYAKLIEKSALQESGEVEYRAKAQVALLHCFKSVGFFNEAVDVIRAFDPKGVPAKPWPASMMKRSWRAMIKCLNMQLRIHIYMDMRTWTRCSSRIILILWPYLPVTRSS